MSIKIQQNHKNAKPKAVKFFTNRKPKSRTSISLSLNLLRLQGNAELLGGFAIGVFLPGVAGGDGDGEESLGLADGSALLELNEVADLELVVGVMGLVLLLLPHAPLVLGVGS